MELDACYKIGWIVKPHGLKGEVTIMLEDDAPEDLSSIESVFLEQNSRLVPYFIEALSAQERKAFIKFEDVDSSEQAKKISKHAVYISKSLRPKASRGEFYDDEVVGFEVYDQAKRLLGEIREVMQAGPNRLLVVQNADKEVLIPVNGPFITTINKVKKMIIVDLPEGFLEL